MPNQIEAFENKTPKLQRPMTSKFPNARMVKNLIPADGKNWLQFNRQDTDSG